MRSQVPSRVRGRTCACVPSRQTAFALGEPIEIILEFTNVSRIQLPVPFGGDHPWRSENDTIVTVVDEDGRQLRDPIEGGAPGNLITRFRASDLAHGRAHASR